MTDYVTVFFFWIFSVYTARARRWLGPQRNETCFRRWQALLFVLQRGLPADESEHTEKYFAAICNGEKI